MKKAWPLPVVRENLSQCWEFMDAQRRSIQIKAVTAKLGGLLSNLLFLFLLIFGANGVILTHYSGSYCTFLKTLPFFMEPWEKLSTLLKLGTDRNGDIGKLILFSYLAAAALFAVLALLVRVVYHPRKQAFPAGTDGENAALLAQLTRDAQIAASRTHISSSVISIVLAILCIFVLFFAYAFHLQDAAAISALLGKFPTSEPATNALIYVLFGYFIGHFLLVPLILITRPLYYVRFPYGMLAEAETAAVFAEEQTDGLTPEEVAQRHLNNAIPLREQAIKAEYDNGYKIAKGLYFKAALGGDIPSMEHYARHCLLDHQKGPARYWLERCVSSEEASPEAKNMLFRLKLGRAHNVEYLQENRDSSLKGRRIRAAKRMLKTLLSTLLVLGLCFGVIYAVIQYFGGGDQSALSAELKDLFGSVAESVTEGADSFTPEEVLPFEAPVMTLTEAGTPWEGACVAYAEGDAPVIFCYGKDLGGDLLVPCDLGEDGTLRKAGIYVGNVWDVRDISKNVSYLPHTRTAVVAQEYLMTLEAGEYFLILNDGEKYIPLLLTEQTLYNSTQRGVAAVGNEIGWIVNDLQAPQDITLHFYNLGDNTIRSLFRLIRSDFSPEPLVEKIDEAFYTISEDCRSVTLKQDFLQQQEVGSYAELRVRLANGDTLDLGNVRIGTTEGDFTGLMEITGEETYSLSQGGDYTASYTFGQVGIPMHLTVSTGSGVSLVEENLSSLISEYLNFEEQTVTLPADLLKGQLTPGEGFHIGISYLTRHNQNAFASLWVEAGW